MTSIVTRTGKGSPLSISELDANFTNLNTDKVEKTRVVGVASGDLTVTNGGALNQDIELGLPNTGVSAGTLNNSATQTTPFTVDAKGRITGTSSPVTLAPDFANVTNKPTTLAGYGITDAQPTITGAASTIDTEDLTASRALASDSSGKVAATAVTATELGYLAGVGQNLQTQLDGKQGTSGKDQANGYAGLNASGKLSDAVLPDLAISDYLGEVADESAMLALTGQKGDWCTRIDAGTIYVITGNPAAAGGWMQLSYPGTPVKSVAGKTGVVTLDKTDVGLSALTNDAQLKIASNLSDLNNAATARTNLGLAIGTDVQAYDADLTAWAGKTAPTGDAVGTTDTQILTNKTLTSPIISSISNTGALTLPTSTDTLVGRATTDTLTNKTISGSSNTLSNIANASLTNSSITFGATSQALGSTVSALNAVSIGQSTAAAGSFTTLSASSTVSGTGFSTYLASPPAIGGITPAAGAFTTLSASSTVSGTGFSTYLASPPAIGGTSPAAGSFTNLSYTGTLTGGTGVIAIGTNQIYKDASGNVGIGTSSPTQPLDVNGNIAITGNARRITGDFSNGNFADRVAFQSSTTNGSTNIAAIPNGTSINSGFRAYAESGLTNARFGQLLANGGGDIRIASDRLGTGTYLPMTFYTGGSERVRIAATTGVVTIGSAISLDPTTANSLVVNSSGNVGIGIGSPAGRLSVLVNTAVTTYAQTWEVYNGATFQFTNTLGGDSTNGVYFGPFQSVPLRLITNATERARITAAGDFISTVNGTAPSLSTNGTMVFALTSNTNLRISVRGTDGTTRVANITLA